MPAAPNQKEQVAVLLEGDEAWSKVCGDSAEKGFLFVVEVFCKWCGPSEAILSTLKRLSMDYNGRKVKFFMVEARESIPELARFTTTSKPSFLCKASGWRFRATYPLAEEWVHQRLWPSPSPRLS